jgi:two-component system sensor kinase FixL
LKPSRMYDFFTLHLLQGRRRAILLWAVLFIVLLAVIDWHFEENISFGFLYLFPMLMVGSCLSRPLLAGFAVLCTALTEAFDPFPWAMPVGISRVVLTFAAFFGAGLYGHISARSRRIADEQMSEMTKEAEARHKAEEQVNFLISSSPASIFTLDAEGRVQLANRAAHQLLGVDNGKLEGERIGQFFPALANVPPAREAPFFHTEMECRGRRQHGEMFLARIFFSTYQTMSGPRLAAVVFDASEDFRDRAEFNLQQVLTGSQIVAGAILHEMRNICSAIAVVHAKIARDTHPEQRLEDSRTLGTLVRSLERMAGLELRQTKKTCLENFDLQSVLEELRIVIEPSFQDSQISVTWEIPRSLPRVEGDHQALLQAFLNIAKNAQRAMEGQQIREMTVRVSRNKEAVVVRFLDTGPGVQDPAQLFTPFQPGAHESGLGLYLSRMFVRSFQGDIDYEPTDQGSCFAVTLAVAAAEGGLEPARSFSSARN